MNYTWSIADETIPSDINPSHLRACIEWACRRAERDSDMGFLFMHDQGGRANHVTFGFDPMARKNQIGSKMTVTHGDGRKVHSIAFNPQERWAVTWWQRIVSSGKDLRMIALHELGHLCGLPHSDDEWSVMHPQPKYAVFNDFDKMELRYLARASK